MAENTPAGENIGDPVEATGSGLTYTLTGDDAASFTIMAESGQIQTGAVLDYETRSVYMVAVTATDAVSEAASIEVTINVSNIDEPGAIGVSSEQPSAVLGISAALSDPDGGVADPVWLWERSLDNSAWTAIDGSATAIYLPPEDDIGSTCGCRRNTPTPRVATSGPNGPGQTP